ncbi:MAG: ATP phosphoribosyltransferase [Erysipelotrichaceae bacterium]|nr:ATP phosphoribosyltransferase [Erysipelotrichaceae bacterium]
MFVEDELLTYGEKLVLELKKLYKDSGFSYYRMSKFEEYDFYAGNKEFLVSDNVITFTDTNGKLMALKPDVTLSIIKNSEDLPSELRKVFYNENVYRLDRNAGVFKEILQTGLECFGSVSKEEMTQVIKLAANSLQLISKDSVLALSDLSLIEEILKGSDLSRAQLKDILSALSARNTGELGQLCTGYGIPENKKELLEKLLNCHGKINEIKEELGKIIKENDLNTSFLDILEDLSSNREAEYINVDFAMIDDISYYNGIIFKGYLSSMPEAVLSGGQYDNLMKKLSRKSKAIGFAVYTGLIEQSEVKAKDDDYINIALPKGRLGDKVYRLFEQAGYECPEILEDNRKLIFENKEKKIRYFWVKPADVAVYVERGAADIGVAGKDILLDKRSAVYELLDLKTGICKMAVAAPKDYKDDPSKTLKVATKFPNIAIDYYRSIGRDIDIIKLNGSIELAPLLELSDVIVDIVETGRTLKENDLEVKEDIMPISARLISNQSSFAFRSGTINQIVNDLSAIVR